MEDSKDLDSTLSWIASQAAWDLIEIFDQVTETTTWPHKCWVDAVTSCVCACAEVTDIGSLFG